MGNSEPPPRRSSIPPVSAEYMRASYEQMHPSPPPFTKHKELARFLADDTTETFIIFTSLHVAKSRSLPKTGAAKAVLRSLRSLLSRRIGQIFIELSPDSRKQISALNDKMASSLARMLAYGGPKKTENIKSVFSLARTAGKNAESRGASPSETALAVCGVFAASAKVFQHQNKFKSEQFLAIAEKISLEMSINTLISFLWKFAELKNSNEARLLFEEALRVQGNEKKILQLLSD